MEGTPKFEGTYKERREADYNLQGGRAIANVQSGDEIVISGMSGVFPDSNNIQEFKENLFNKVNMVLPNRRWDLVHPEIPPRTGSIPDIEQYDRGFFGVHERQSDSLDPISSLLQEKVVEAIMDAGLNPLDLENTRTGVFVGCCYSENDKTWYFNNLIPNSYAMTGALRSMVAHRLSYFLKVKGPSYVTDTACSSSLYALEHAYRALRKGEIDYAIVGGGNLCLHPLLNLQFARLGVLSMDGICKAFDELGNGYVRSEAVGVLFLQRAKNAKRIYAEVIYAKTNCDGYKEQGITFPSKQRQGELLAEFYEECGVDKYSLSFLEAHGTGTSVGDPEESAAIDDVLAKGRKGSLLIGSVKSNIGHSEPSSGICSIIKSIIGMETGFIPPNINFNKPRPEIKGIVEGRLKVVTQKQKFDDDRGIIGVNSFGFGGGNCHVLLRWNPKTKLNHGIPKDHLPRLVCVSGRTKAAIASLLDSLDNGKLDTEYIKLLHETFRSNIEAHLYRGYTIVSQYGRIARSVKYLKYFPDNSPPLYFDFGMLNNWYDIGCDLMAHSAFLACIERIQKLLHRKVNILDVLLKKSNNDINSLLGSAVVQIGLISLFHLVELKPTGILGFPFAELLYAYCDGSLSLEETVNYIFSISTVLNDITLDFQNNNNLEDSDVVTSHNGYTLQNGTESTVDHISISLKSKVSSSMKNHLLQNVLKDLGYTKNNGNKKRVENFVNSIFEENTNIPNQDSLLVKIGDTQSKQLENASNIILFDKKAKNYLVEFMKGLGSLYEHGYNPQISKMYPPVPLPVGRGTEMISPYVKWNHRKPKSVPKYHVENLTNEVKCGNRMVLIEAEDNEWKYIRGHVIDGRNLFPAAGYLYLVWETFSVLNDLELSLSKVSFENCRFLRATTVPKQGYFNLHIYIQSGNGNFEVTEGNSIVVTGRIFLLGPDASSENLLQRSELDKIAPGMNLKNKDIYKELRLRGYNYKGDFRAIEECNSSASKAYIKWDENWVTFVDNMLQLKILQSDTRLLYVPTFISKLTILGNVHSELVNNATKNEQNAGLLPVVNNTKTGVISSGGITICGLIASSIPRKKLMAVPILESYKFIPNFTELDVHQSVRVNMQIILENSLEYKVKAVELIDEFTKEDLIPLTPLVKQALEDQPLIQPSLKIFSKTPLPTVEIDVENKKLESESDCLLVIASNVLSRSYILEKISSVLTEDGFILTRESHKFYTPKNEDRNFSVFTVHRTANETLVLLRKRRTVMNSKYVKVNDTQNFVWLPEVQNTITKERNQDLVLYAENEYKNGVLGLVNCLRREPQSKNVRCLFMMDKTEEFNPQVSFYRNQLEKNMAVNIYKNGQWGTYRHLLLEKENNVESEHCFLNLTVRGDLSSLKWMEGSLRHNMKTQTEEDLIYVYYSALNFRDIMTATGKINVDVITQDRLAQECVQGFEFSGRDKKGKRYMGMVSCGALSTLILSDVYLKFPIPDSWSLEEAATVPVVYATVIYALITRGQMARGESILIHSGTGGIGQAAIRIALFYDCTVFTTVGTKEKRDFLKKTFPQLKDKNIGNSHDEFFEQWILTETKGRGVDLVLNSLAEEKLVASVRCLARGGRFIEIGKFDLANNHHLSLLLFQEGINFQGVMLDQLFNDSPQIKQELLKTMTHLIDRGAVKPLNRTVFKYSQVEQAFRFMATGKHMGKVLVQIREPEKEPIVSPSPSKFPGLSRYFCNSQKVYVIAGGLGGFGLELTDWLILRGARRIVLTSRKGITNGYQEYRLGIWERYGAIVKVSTAPITTREGCKQLIKESLQLGRIDAIFNLAVVLADGVFENQTPESFVTSFGPKAYATQYLDDLTRKECPDLSQFVVFSSVSCGRGNAGQTNYGMSNSAMERLCEERRQAGYPGLAIEWGAVGEVGLVAEMMEDNTEIEIGGTLQQRISNCLQVLDNLLRQTDDAIVSSMVVAEKKVLSSADNIIDAVLNILGITDSKSVSLHSTLAELGMDSMTGVEIKQILERDFEVFLTTKDIRTVTLAKLRDVQDERVVRDPVETNSAGIELLFRLLGDVTYNPLPYLELESKVPKNAHALTVLLFPGIEGAPNVFQDFTKHLNFHTIGLNLNTDVDEPSIVKMAQALLPIIQRHFPHKTFNLVAYSFGTVIAVEVVKILESVGYSGTLLCIDGSYLLIKQLLIDFGIEMETDYETTLICYILSFFITWGEVDMHKESILKCANWDEKLNLAVELMKNNTVHDINYQKVLANGIYQRCRAMMTYTPSNGKLKTNVILVKPTQASVKTIPEDYGLSEYFEKPIEVHTFEGNHVTILENEAVAALINSSLQ